mgnify:FL=1
MRYKSKKLKKLERNRTSVFTNNLNECYLCGSTYQMTKHEIFEGRNRRNSMLYGFVLPLCLSCHMNITNDNKFLLDWKCKAQNYFETNIGSKDDFIKTFGKDYIYICTKKRDS